MLWIILTVIFMKILITEKQLEEKDKLIEKLRKNIAALSEYAEIDVDEDGELVY